MRVLTTPASGHDVFMMPNTDALVSGFELSVIIAILAGMNKAPEAL